MIGMPKPAFWRIVFVAVALLLCSTLARPSQGQQPPQRQQEKTPQLTEPDALHVMQNLGDGLESHNERAFLAVFDPQTMSDYPLLRDQVHGFFQEYESFQVSYQLQQVAMEGVNGVALFDFTLDARPAGGELPDVRSTVQLRLVLAWNGKEWKIVGLSPREVFA